jgi:hypothetical protein
MDRPNSFPPQNATVPTQKVLSVADFLYMLTAMVKVYIRSRKLPVTIVLTPARYLFL